LAAAELERQWSTVADAKQILGIRGTLRFALEASGRAGTRSASRLR
jgi:hypothetical protein